MNRTVSFKRTQYTEKYISEIIDRMSQLYADVHTNANAVVFTPAGEQYYSMKQVFDLVNANCPDLLDSKWQDCKSSTEDRLLQLDQHMLDAYYARRNRAMRAKVRGTSPGLVAMMEDGSVRLYVRKELYAWMLSAISSKHATAVAHTLQNL
jgi:hypothetical protein